MGEVEEVPSRHLTIPIWYKNPVPPQTPGEDPQARRAMTGNGLYINIIGSGGPFQIGRSGANGAVDESRREVRSIPQSGSHEQIPNNPNIIEMIRNGLAITGRAL